MRIIRNKKTKKITRLKIGEREREIIQAIGAGIGITALIAAMCIAPGLSLAMKPFFKRQGKTRFKKDLDRLRNKGLIYLGGSKIKLTAKGLQLQKISKLEEMSLRKSKKWDGYWRLISYDVPETDKNNRDYFRKTIEKWGFKKVQQSLWAYPYNCKEEIAVLADSLYIAPYVMYMTTDEMPEEDYWQEHFEL